MTVIRVAYLREFHFGDDAVLLAVEMILGAPGGVQQTSQRSI